MSAYRQQPLVPVTRTTWWDLECEQLARAALERHCRKLAARAHRRAVHFADVAARLRRRHPRCASCARRVDSYVVVHDSFADTIGLRVQCHGVTRVRDLHRAEVENLNFVHLADWLGLPAF